MSLVLFQAFVKFHSTYKLFKTLKRRYNSDQVKLLDNLVGLKGKIQAKKCMLRYLNSCLHYKVVPSFIAQRMKASKVKNSRTIDTAFIKDEAENIASSIKYHRNKFKTTWSEARKSVSFYDLFRVSRYICKINEELCVREKRKHSKQLQHLIQKKYGADFNYSGNVVNLSDYTLNENERFVLEHGLHFAIPPQKINKEEIFAEFESLHAQLLHHTPTSTDAFDSLKSKLTSTAYEFSEIDPRSLRCVFDKDHFQALAGLRRNKDLVITKPDKGSGVVILSKSDYVSKMADVLKDESKFIEIGPADTNDRTHIIEDKFISFLKELHDSKKIDEELYSCLYPVGSRRPRLYGLPKIHKDGNPLRPVLSTIGSPQSPIARYLKIILQPVLDKYFKYCLKDSFKFADYIKAQSFNNKSVFMCSYDVKSLFTCIPVEEVIDICAEDLYNDPSITPPPYDKSIFIEFMRFATCCIEFSFNDTMYRQINGLGMGSILSSILANIFVGYHEKKLFSSNCEYIPEIYFRYVDDSFAVFFDINHCSSFLDVLNSLHPDLEFTIEMEENNRLPFLDVLVEKKDDYFTTSIFRKKTFTGLYQRWDAFSPEQVKINLIHMLVHRAVSICTKSMLEEELGKIREILLNNGYPSDIVDKNIRLKLSKYGEAQQFTPKKCPVYLKLPYLGDKAKLYADHVRKAVKKTFNAVTLRTVFSTKSIFPASRKDVLPIHQNSNVIYKFTCKHCDCAYIGRTTQRLGDRIAQHIPKAFRQVKKNNDHLSSKSSSSYNLRKRKPVSYVYCNLPTYVDSAVGIHLLENPACAQMYSDEDFTILSRARSKYHLNILEAMFINSMKPELCRQKTFVYYCKLFPNHYKFKS